jgi:hypothetical protein
MGSRLPKVQVISPFCKAKQNDPKLQLEIYSIWAGLEGSPLCNVKNKHKMGKTPQSAQYYPKQHAEIPFPILKN